MSTAATAARPRCGESRTRSVNSAAPATAAAATGSGVTAVDHAEDRRATAPPRAPRPVAHGSGTRRRPSAAAATKPSASSAAIMSCAPVVPADGVRGGEEQRQADARRLVQAAVGQPGLGQQLLGRPGLVHARAVLVAQVDVGVGRDRLDGHQHARLAGRELACRRRPRCPSVAAYAAKRARKRRVARLRGARRRTAGRSARGRSRACRARTRRPSARRSRRPRGRRRRISARRSHSEEWALWCSGPSGSA